MVRIILGIVRSLHCPIFRSSCASCAFAKHCLVAIFPKHSPDLPVVVHELMLLQMLFDISQNIPVNDVAHGADSELAVMLNNRV